MPMIVLAFLFLIPVSFVAGAVVIAIYTGSFWLALVMVILGALLGFEIIQHLDLKMERRK